MEVSCVVYGGLHWDEETRKRQEGKIGNVAKGLFVHLKAVSLILVRDVLDPERILETRCMWGGKTIRMGREPVAGPRLTELFCPLYAKQRYRMCPN